MSASDQIRQPIRKREEWIWLIEEASRSGKTVREFCAAYDIAEHSFYGWRRRLRGEEDTRREALFVPVRVKAEAKMLSPPSQINARFFVQGAGGLQLEFPSGCTEAELRLVARVLSC